MTQDNQQDNQVVLPDQAVPGRVLVTGASSGIGEASARAFATAGFNLVLVARREKKVAALANELRQLGVDAQALSVDLADLVQIKAKIHSLVKQVGPIDVLINSAGMGYTGALSDMPLADWSQLMNLNVSSVFQVTQAVLPAMRQRRAGLIVNIASIAARQPFPGWGAYGVSKAAVMALSEAIAQEESAHGIRVVTLSPGAVNTPLWDSKTVTANLDRSLMLDPETVAKTILHTALLPPEAVISHLTITPTVGAL